jgi:hypothetical protein
MTMKDRRHVPDIQADPFGERSVPAGRRQLQLMGGRFHFESNSAELLRLVDAAYEGLPAHRFSPRPPRFRVKLILASSPGRRMPASARAPRRPRAPPIPMLNGAGFLGCATDNSTFVVLSPEDRTALIFVSKDMLRLPYHVRYELIEFAILTLASRAQQLVPLHAACVGHGGRGVLLMGASGAGKSTVALRCLTEGFEFLAEDSVFVEPNSMRGTGTANFMHIRSDSLAWLEPRIRGLIRKSPVILRRSGVRKYEINLRGGEFNLAERPLKIVAVAFLSARSGGTGSLVHRLSPADTRARMMREQAYGASLPQWKGFSRDLSELGGFEILRGADPSTSVAALRAVLGRGLKGSRQPPK